MDNEQNKPITVFISYSWDDKAHKAWVRKLSDRLKEEGIEVLLDQYQEPGTSLTAFMQDGLSNADRVLVIGSPNYKRKAESHKGGTNVEDQIINIHMSRDFTTTKFIPILRKGSYSDSFTVLVGDRIGFDFSDDASFESDFQMLIEGLKEGLIRTPKDNQTNQSILEIPWNITNLDRGIVDIGKYYGAITNGKPNGIGRFNVDGGTIYKGKFKDGVFLEGVVERNNGDIEEGKFKDGVLNGKGKKKTVTGDVEDGKFKDGIFLEGVVTRNNGNVEEGEFKDGALNGKGKISKPDGSVEEGEFKKGRLNGHGKKESVLFSSEGEFKNGRLNGKGKRMGINGLLEDGEFVLDLLHGHGKRTYPNEIVEEGKFSGGGFVQGKRTYPDGRIEEGDFNNGVLIKPQE